MNAKERRTGVLEAFEAEIESSAVAALNHMSQGFDVFPANESYALNFQLNPQGLVLATITQPPSLVL